MLLTWGLMTLYAQNNVEASEENQSVVADTMEITSDSLLTDTLTVDSTLVWPNNVFSRIAKLLQSKMFKTSMVGIQVYDLTTD